jgi:hypothetical protein
VATRAAALAVAAAAILAAPATAAAPALKPSLARVVGGTVVVDGRRLFRGATPAWSPDGSQLAFARDGDLWIANADGFGQRRLTLTERTEEDPAWAPDGRRIAFSVGENLYVLRVRAASVGRLGPGAHPAWARDGRLAYELDGTIHSGTTPLVAGEQPAWSPDGRSLAFVREGQPYRVEADGTGELRLAEGVVGAAHPVWSPAGTRIAYVTELEIVVVDARGGTPVALSPGTNLAWANVPVARELLPDLVQRLPSQLYVTQRGRRRLLAFGSAVENVGQGVLWIQGRRPRGRRVMRADQLVRRSDGTVQRLANAGFLRYDRAPTHSHWHFQPFERYELYGVGGAAPLVRDRKQGFCFGDRFRGRNPRPPRFRAGDCGLGRPSARRVVEGTSVGYVDIYPPELHGQFVDVTGLRAGRYVLVHRANPQFGLRERSYANNQAGVLIQLGRAAVRVLGRCDVPAACR